MTAADRPERPARCPLDGQTLAWHRATDPEGTRTHGEFIGCTFGSDRPDPTLNESEYRVETQHAEDCLPDPDRDPYVGCCCGATRRGSRD